MPPSRLLKRAINNDTYTLFKSVLDCSVLRAGAGTRISDALLSLFVDLYQPTMNLALMRFEAGFRRWKASSVERVQWAKGARDQSVVDDDHQLLPSSPPILR